MMTRIPGLLVFHFTQLIVISVILICARSSLTALLMGLRCTFPFGISHTYLASHAVNGVAKATGIPF